MPRLHFARARALLAAALLALAVRPAAAQTPPLQTAPYLSPIAAVDRSVAGTVTVGLSISGIARPLLLGTDFNPVLPVASRAGRPPLDFGVVGGPLVAVGTPGSSNLFVGEACDPLTISLVGSIALIERGVCTFSTKILNAQAAGAVGVLLYDNAPTSPSRPLIVPSASDDQPDPTIPALILERELGRSLFANGGPAGISAAVALSFTPVPEPATLALVGGGLAVLGGLAGRRRGHPSESR